VNNADSAVEHDFSHAVIGAAVEVQRVLGTGLLESAYSAAMAIELAEREIGFERDVPIHGTYRGRPLGIACRADFIVEKSLMLGIKGVDSLSELHRASLLSGLRLGGYRLGLLINFHAFPVVKGIYRLENKL
jgi:GxxExxY protein